MPLTSKLTRTAAAALLATSAGCIEIDKEKFEATQGAIFRWGGRSHPNPRVGLAGELLGDAADASYQHDQDSRIARETGEALVDGNSNLDSSTTLGEAIRNSPEFQRNQLIGEIRRRQLIESRGIVIHEPPKGYFINDPFSNAGNIFNGSKRIGIGTIVSSNLVNETYIGILVENLDTKIKTDMHDDSIKDKIANEIISYSGFGLREGETYIEVIFDIGKLREHVGRGNNFKAEVYMTPNKIVDINTLKEPLYTKKFLIEE